MASYDEAKLFGPNVPGDEFFSGSGLVPLERQRFEQQLTFALSRLYATTLAMQPFFNSQTPDGQPPEYTGDVLNVQPLARGRGQAVVPYVGTTEDRGALELGVANIFAQTLAQQKLIGEA